MFAYISCIEIILRIADIWVTEDLRFFSDLKKKPTSNLIEIWLKFQKPDMIPLWYDKLEMTVCLAQVPKISLGFTAPHE